jgi:sporulation protein YlmC with PRC-barrel domain
MRKSLLAGIAALALIVPGLALAQTTTPAPDQGDTMTAPTTGPLSGATAEEMIGRNVVDITGETVGSISDLMLGPDGQVTHVIVDVGGFLGIGAKTVALDAAALTAEEGDGGDLVTSMTRDQIEALPEYEQRDGQWLPVN